MTQTIEVKVPDIGDFKDIPVIEVLVKPGDSVNKEDSLITLESDKATMEVPSPEAGVVKEVKVKVGDKTQEGAVILTLDTAGATAAAAPPTSKAAPSQPATAKSPPVPASQKNEREDSPKSPSAPAAAAPQTAEKADLQVDVVVLGAGPGGYTAAFRAADLGKKVALIERYPTLGGVCLNVGCIPSKALLHIARVLTEAQEVSDAGIRFAKPEIDVDKLRAWKAGVVGKLTRGLSGLAGKRKVEVIQGRGTFASPHTIRVETASGVKTVGFDSAIIAAGSSAAKIPGFPYDDKRIFDSTGALELPEIPKRLLVIGGGIIGLEMATVYDALGSRVTVVELMDALIPGADRDVVRPLAKRIEKRYEKILLKTKVAKIEPRNEGLRVTFEGDGAPRPDTFDYVLMAVGRRPNGRDINAEAAGVNVGERGFIAVDKQLRTNVPHIFAIGDICGEPMLAHKATHEGKIAAEVIAGHKAAFDARAIPSVAYTDPEVAWMGLTETQAAKDGTPFEKAVFPWAASGRALATGRDEGMTKLLFDPQSRRILGAALIGPNAGELIAETVLALEMGADMNDIALTIHPHPTLSETVFFAAEAAEGSITDLYLPKR
ncbi:MAG TPA: dihydrolipoyl dehydrogenase [Burkholderiales bacterium]|nr:dihydrolipoyl dehydrogenase [Burkholderiales bacterium]